jgi:hypothetical protein
LERVSFAVVGVLLSSAVASAAAQANTARLEVDAAPGCSTRDELIARVAARSTRIRFVNDATGVPALTARIEAGPRGGVVAELIVVEPDGRRFARRLEAPSCAAATDAVALVVAITLDPSAATGEASAAAGTTGTETDAAGKGPPAAGTTSPTPPPTPEPAAELPPRDAASGNGDVGEAPVPATRRLTAGVAAAAVVGPAPTPMPGIAIEVQGALDRASILSPALVLTLSHVWSGGQMEPGGIAAFTLDLPVPSASRCWRWKRAPAPPGRWGGWPPRGRKPTNRLRWPAHLPPSGEPCAWPCFSGRASSCAPDSARGRPCGAMRSGSIERCFTRSLRLP